MSNEQSYMYTQKCCNATHNPWWVLPIDGYPVNTASKQADRYLVKYEDIQVVVSAFSLAFSSSDPMSNPDTDLTLRCLGGLLSLATITLVWTSAHCSSVLTFWSSGLLHRSLLMLFNLMQVTITSSLTCIVSATDCVILWWLQKILFQRQVRRERSL